VLYDKTNQNVLYVAGTTLKTMMARCWQKQNPSVISYHHLCPPILGRTGTQGYVF